jgi:hypothetical protein
MARLGEVLRVDQRAAAFVLVFAASAAYAQFRSARLPIATRESFDGAFQYCRAAYRGIQGGVGGGWSTDYPDADLNLSTRLGELTKTPVSKNTRTGEPNHLIVPITDPMLFHCPFIMMFEVGNLYFDESEAQLLRDYLHKGGFLWVDDFWGTYAWNVWESQIRKVLPAGEYPFKDLQLDHPIFNQFFEVKKKAQIPSINHWMAYRDTSERFADSRQVNFRAITDDRDRIMVLITHNTDFGDSWEREGVSHDYFVNFSVDGYAFGINALLYALTH